MDRYSWGIIFMIRHVENILVTGGSGFIGSAFIRYIFSCNSEVVRVVNLDLLTYASNPCNLMGFERDPRYYFIQGDINDEAFVEQLCLQHNIDTIVHFAAETHVDKSIESVWQFIKTNIEGTVHLLEVVRRRPHVHFHHVSTDEVYGSLEDIGSFDELSLIHPNSPYAASKASSDHFVRCYAHTYNLSCTLSHCSNNYGPGQHNEKFIPRVLSSLFHSVPIPIYGTGRHIRNWLFVEDHIDALWKVIKYGKGSDVYNIGSSFESTNIDLVHTIIGAYSMQTGRSADSFKELISFVEDRPGHDFRYSIDSSKIQRDLGWAAKHQFDQALIKTIDWYLKNPATLHSSR